jgi:hypothetical protein
MRGSAANAGESILYNTNEITIQKYNFCRKTLKNKLKYATLNPSQGRNANGTENSANTKNTWLF